MGLVDRLRKKDIHEKRVDDVDTVSESLKKIRASILKKLLPRISIMDLGDALEKAAFNSRWSEVIEYGGELAQRFRYNKINGGGFGFFQQLNETVCYQHVGNAYRELGEFKKAIEFHEKSLELAKSTGDDVALRIGYANLGYDYCREADFRKAIEFHEKSLELARNSGDKRIIGANYVGLGHAYYYLGHFKKAVDFYEKSRGITKGSGDKSEGLRYAALGAAYERLGHFRKAIAFYEECLEIAEDSGDMRWKSTCYNVLGMAYCGLKNYKEGIKLFRKNLQISKNLGDKRRESESYKNLGLSYHALGNFKEAIELYKESLEISEEIRDIRIGRATNLALGFIYGGLGKPKLAYSYCQRSIELSEMIQGSLLEEEHKISFAGQISDAYQLMIPLCVTLKKDDEAFEYIERSKSRAFLDLLAATEIKPSVELTSELSLLLDNEENCLGKLREIHMRHLRQTQVSVEPGEVDRIREELDDIYSKIEEYDPEYVFIRSGKPLSVAGVREMLSSRGKNVILIEYFVTKDETFVFVVSSKDEQLHIQSVPISEEKLSRYVQVFEREMVDYHGAIGDTWLSLSSYLIEPISQYLAEAELIYFVPYGPLHYLPMHALELDGEPLIKKHPVAYSPSASLLKFCKSKGSGKLERCASFGVAFEEEAKGVAELFNTKACNDIYVTKDRVCKNCTDKDVIHFSCHGHFDDTEPLSSGVKLYDGVLKAREIFDMRLNTELVTLSACQTGLNERRPGDELIGLTRAFLYAGAPSVVVSLWSVDAGSTQELMLEFYKLLKNGSDKAAALQEAQKKIMEQDKYSHPYYWAPFVLVGNWK